MSVNIFPTDSPFLRKCFHDGKIQYYLRIEQRRSCSYPNRDHSFWSKGTRFSRQTALAQCMLSYLYRFIFSFLAIHMPISLHYATFSIWTCGKKKKKLSSTLEFICKIGLPYYQDFSITSLYCLSFKSQNTLSNFYLSRNVYRQIKSLPLKLPMASYTRIT